MWGGRLNEGERCSVNWVKYKSIQNMSPVPDRFDYLIPTEEQLESINHIRKQFKTVRASLENCPASREKSLALTSLEEGLEWATKAVILN